MTNKYFTLGNTVFIEVPKNKSEIILAAISKEDFDLVESYKGTWRAIKRRNTFYVTIDTFKAPFNHVHEYRTTVLLHRVITGVNDRSIHVDHDDGDGLNNQRDNLKIMTHSEHSRKPRSHWKGKDRDNSFENEIKRSTNVYENMQGLL